MNGLYYNNMTRAIGAHRGLERWCKMRHFKVQSVLAACIRASTSNTLLPGQVQLTA